MWKGTKLYSIFRMKCPRCHESDLFTSKNPYDLSKIFAMPERCSKCGQKYEVEPGFFYGSMYVSYGLSVAYLVAVWVAMLVLYPDFTTTEYLVTSIASLIVWTPYFFRLARAIWINLFVKYDPQALDHPRWTDDKQD